MQVGAITGYVDLAQIILYLFWIFFAGIIFYLVLEGHREGYPMESEGRPGSAPVTGWPIPAPKTFRLANGKNVTVPELDRPEPPQNTRRDGMSIPSSCVPCSATEPLSNTIIRSASRIVDNRCAMTIAVRLRIAASSAFWTRTSPSLSRWLVASSRIITAGFFNNNRAIARRCFSPPESR